MRLKASITLRSSLCQGGVNAPVSDQQQDEQLLSEATFADRLNYLFRTRLSPSGVAFTNKQVSEASDGKLSPQYISQLRRGDVSSPGIDKLHAFARVFGVEDSFFFAGASSMYGRGDPRQVDEDTLLREAMQHPIMRDILLESREYGPDEWAILLEMMGYVRAQIARNRPQRRVVRVRTRRRHRSDKSVDLVNPRDDV